MSVSSQIEVIPPKIDESYYKHMTMNAYQVLSQTKKGRADISKFTDVIAGLCRQAYLKGRHDERNGNA